MNEELFKRLLYATHNIGGNAEPEEPAGIVSSAVALLLAERMFPTEQEIRDKLLQLGYGQTVEQLQEFDPNVVPIDEDDVAAGRTVVATLMAECLLEDNPVDYAEAMIALGLQGLRVESIMQWGHLANVLNDGQP